MSGVDLTKRAAFGLAALVLGTAACGHGGDDGRSDVPVTAGPRGSTTSVGTAPSGTSSAREAAADSAPSAAPPSTGPAASSAPESTVNPAATTAARPSSTSVAPAPGVAEQRFTVDDGGRGRSFDVVVRLPAGADGAPAAGLHPVVAFSHGLRSEPQAYDALLDRFVAAGFAVVAPLFPHTRRGADDLSAADVVEQPGDVSAALVAVFARPDLASSLDSTRIAAVGHSEGAITTLGLFDGCCRDPRISAGVVLAGNTLGFREEYTGDPAPILFVHGDDDRLVPYASGRLAFDTDPWPKAFLTIAGGDHLQPYLTAGSADANRVADAAVEFVRWALLGDVDALAALRATESGALDDQLG